MELWASPAFMEMYCKATVPVYASVANVGVQCNLDELGSPDLSGELVQPARIVEPAVSLLHPGLTSAKHNRSHVLHKPIHTLDQLGGSQHSHEQPGTTREAPPPRLLQVGPNRHASRFSHTHQLAVQSLNLSQLYLGKSLSQVQSRAS